MTNTDPTKHRVAQASLDPDDPEAFRREAHRLLDVCLGHLERVGQSPVWRPVPAAVLQHMQLPAPQDGMPLEELTADFEKSILPYSTGNTHPRFFGWVHGAGTPVGMLGEMCAAAMNSNCGGRDHGAVYVERQVIEWCREVFGFPGEASGILTTGTSMATVIALAAARIRKFGPASRAKGLRTQPQLVGYASAEAHSAIGKAFDLLGIGSEFLRRIPIDEAHALQTTNLARQIAEDRRSGLEPFAVIATAGTVNAGGFDDLSALADLAEAEDLWLHVDGAFGAWARIAGAPWDSRTAGIERADSLAFDFHKWMSVPYDCGCVLIRDGAAHRAAFAERPDYLSANGLALAGGEPWFCDYGIDLSRGFRALKVWFTLQAFGLERLGGQIEKNCLDAAHLGQLVNAADELEILAPVGLNVCCFRFRYPDMSEPELERLNQTIVARLQEDGIAAPSTTRIKGKLAIRACLVNHRTTTEDVEILAREVIRLGRELSEPANSLAIVGD
jgi:glutamate/tyrosine decarboxylase-like PLP-dependent enzyme